MPEILDMITIAPGALRGGPTPRNAVTGALWEEAAGELGRGVLTLLSLWASAGAVHMALAAENLVRMGESAEEEQACA